MCDFDTLDIRNEWVPDTEVPKRLRSIYFYWRGKGFVAIVLNRTLTLVSITFMAILIFTVALCIDYHLLFQRQRTPTDIITTLKYPTITTTPERVFIVFFSVFLIYWTIKFLETVRLIYSMHTIRKYIEWLDIEDEDIQNLPWATILDTIVANQKKSLNRVRPLTHLEIVNLIMYQENFIIALLDDERLNLGFPFLCGAASKDNMYCMSKIVTWSLELTLFRYIFSGPGGMIRDEFYYGRVDNSTAEVLTNRLKWIFRLYGILFLIFCPFIYTWLLIYFALKYGEQLKNDPGNSIGVRSWSVLVRWKFRNYNELSHIFDERLAYAYQPTVSYIDCFRSHVVDTISRFLSFIIGSIFITLLVAGLYDDAFLVQVEILGSNSLIWLGILVPILSVLRHTIQKESFIFEPNKYLTQMIKYTHHCPEHWLQMSGTGPNNRKLADILRGAQHDVYEEITKYFPHKLKLWIMEVVTILMIPILFVCVLPGQSKRLVKFFREYTSTENLIHGCIYANFDNFAINHKVEQDVLMVNEMLHTGKIRLPTTSQCEHWGSGHFSTNNKKVELSIANFAINYPSWHSGNRHIVDHLSVIDRCHRKYHTEVTIQEKYQDKYDPIESLIYYKHN